LTCIFLRRRFLCVTSRTACNIRDVTPGTLTATDTCIWYHVTRFEASRNVILHTRYVSTCVGVGCGTGRETKNTKAIRCGAFNYSIVLSAHRVTSMADTVIDAVRKRKNAECIKQYGLKRKLLMQRQASTSTKTE
jgi:hypothetical protein